MTAPWDSHPSRKWKVSMENARAHLLISGRVQGVFYRAFTEDAAHSLGLKGWVRNCSDGKVEALFEGEKENIEKAIGLLLQRPSCRKSKQH